jgi:hypothetical protein
VDRIKDYTMFVSKYRLIIVNVGTNNIEENSQEEITEKFNKVITEIRVKNPKACIAINSIFFRPRDIPDQMATLELRKKQKNDRQQTTPPGIPTTSNTDPPPSTLKAPPKKPLTSQQKYKALHPMEKKRRTTNKSVRKLCNATGCLFLESWRCVQDKKTKEVDLNYFADDGLHLNDQGIASMSEYIDGNVQRLLPADKPPKKRKRKAKAHRVLHKNPPPK